MRVSLPKDDALFRGALEIADRLRGAQHEVYAAGGCVRDLVRGEAPKDYDLVTDATPEEVGRLFRRTVLVGAAFGVVRVLLGGNREYEVATYRRESAYSDGRHPDLVEYSTRKEEDVERRDFTINALLLDLIDGQVIDLVGGCEDLARGVIRAVGDPAIRFKEDRLRMLRAVRFAARLGFEIEAETLATIDAEAPHIASVSAERIVTELDGILLSKRPALGFELLRSTRLLSYVLPCIPQDDALIERLVRLPDATRELHPRDRVLVGWGALMLDATGDLEAELRALKMSRGDLRAIQRLVDARALLLEPEAHPEHARARLALDPSFAAFRAFAEVIGGPSTLALGAWARIREALESKPLPLMPLVTGDDLKAMGVPPGPAYKALLASLEIEVLERRIETRDAALEFIKERIAEGA